jgi:hypothetical protein
LVAGGAGTLGSAVLEAALGLGRFARVTALCRRPMGAALQGLGMLAVEGFDRLPPSLVADTAIVVIDRERGLHGREAAFLQPEPSELPALAAALHDAGVRHLVVVLPHAPAMLPQALRQGLASLDEQAVTRLGFTQLVFVRPTGAAGRPVGQNGLTRLASLMLAQLRFVVPQQEQPLRVAKVADVVARLAWALDSAPPGTRVVSPELLWLAAQVGTDEVLGPWLVGQPLPAPRLSTPRYWSPAT